MTTITNVGEFVRGTTIRTSADRMLAYHVREFVRAMDAAGIPDETQVDAHRAHDTMHFSGLSVRIEERAAALSPEGRQEPTEWPKAPDGRYVTQESKR